VLIWQALKDTQKQYISKLAPNIQINVHLYSQSAMIMASDKGYPEILRLLNIRAKYQNKFVHIYVQYGESALIMASAKGYSEIVRLLLEIGAKFDLRKQVGSREED